PEAQQRGGGVADTDGCPAGRLLCGEIRGRACLERCRDEGVAVALGGDGRVELAGPERSGVDACPFDADIGPDQLTAQVGAQFRRSENQSTYPDTVRRRACSATTHTRMSESP